MSDTSRRIAGSAWLTIDGLGFAVTGEPGYRLSTVTRETMVSMSGVDGYREAPVAPYIKAQLRDMPGISIADFEGMTNVTVELQLNNGKTITGVGMWCTSAVEVGSGDAAFSVQFEGDYVESDE
ncbi:phage tail tube protein [Roseomonas xinghualingensis]|uniref:phage tail tube protein n=1 Tax=Roseomonas xinghualingensis TaxID=2986475 RepID=UPI0021F19776|nr:phage tail tube protein [Roseomonas sp. SXEYE001]MCV4207571.1 phage tail tube protein [Roseomonas sp. SXEYE001]